MTIINIINNKDRTYTGDLKHYFRITMRAPNVLNPYHGIRHMLHVLWECYQGAIALGIDGEKLRCLLIAALFHDYDHSGKLIEDNKNIERAITGMQIHLLPEDKQHESTIESLIRCTAFPHIGDPSSTLHALLRDVDLAQGLSETWIEHILFRLSQEKGNTMESMLERQTDFLQVLEKGLYTMWARKKYCPKITARLEEVRLMKEVLL
jgi:hypothetical protein